ncbi:MAG: hypothetical protein BIFFINMI_02865 [Phycisphaerae bacterium]|nr:hypothetical protein [Phycisphaerae bacterium]
MKARLIAALAALTLLTLAATSPAAVVYTFTTYNGNQTVSANLDDSLASPDQVGVKVQSGIVEFTGNNSYTGGTIVEGGTFKLSSLTGWAGGPVEVQNAATLWINQTVTKTNSIGGNLVLNAGAIVKDSGGTWNAETTTTLTGAVSLGGQVTFNIGDPGQTFPILKLSGQVSDQSGKVGSIVVNGVATTPAYQRYLMLAGDNNFTGGVTINTQGQVYVTHNHGLGTGTATVNSGALLNLKATTITNNINLNDGGELRSDVALVYDGTITLTGTGKITSNVQNYTLKFNQTSGKLTGTGGVNFDGIYYNGYTKFYLYGNNDYTGATQVSSGAIVYVVNANSLGTTANTVTVSGTGTGGTGQGELVIDSTATTGLNVNKTISVGQYGRLSVANGVTMSNAVQMNDGSTLNAISGGAGDRFYIGNMTLTGTAAVNVYYSGGGTWKQGINSTGVKSGTIDGAGKLVIGGIQWYSAPTLYLYGNNSYQGGTDVYRGNSGLTDIVRIGSNTAFGAGLVHLISVSTGGYLNSNTVSLLQNVSLANDFSGTGKIGTGAYTLTATGTWYPGDSIGEIKVENLDFRGGYVWEYDGTSADLISATNLTFGGPAVIGVSWIGSGDAVTGDFVAFTYTGADPNLANVSVVAPEGLAGSVLASGGQVIVHLTEAVSVPEPATLAFLALGGLVLAGGTLRRCRRA